jgi:hypothetical protein
MLEKIFDAAWERLLFTVFLFWLAFILSIPMMWTWNGVMAGAFGAPTISGFEAIGLNFMLVFVQALGRLR